MNHLGEVCDILDTKRKPITKSNRVAGPFPYYGASGVLDYVDGFLFDEELVLVGEDGAKWGAGESSAFPVVGKCWVNNHAHVLRPNRFLLMDCWLISFLNFSDLSEHITGLTVPKLNQGKLREIQIPLPPLPEQERIVGILDEAFEGIAAATAHAEKNLNNARELFQSVLQDTFSKKGEGWEETTLGELGKVSMCKRILKNQTSTIGDIPFYKIGTFGKKPNAFIPNNIYQDYRGKYQFPKKGDILISASGTIGRRVIYDGEPAYFQDSNIVWIANSEGLVINSFLYYFYEICEWNPSKGATISRLYNDDLRVIKVSFPVDRLQQADLVRMFEKLESDCQKLEAIYERKKAALAELKQSLLQKAFSGQL